MLTRERRAILFTHGEDVLISRLTSMIETVYFVWSHLLEDYGKLQLNQISTIVSSRSLFICWKFSTRYLNSWIKFLLISLISLNFVMVSKWKSGPNELVKLSKWDMAWAYPREGEWLTKLHALLWKCGCLAARIDQCPQEKTVLWTSRIYLLTCIGPHVAVDLVITIVEGATA